MAQLIRRTVDGVGEPLPGSQARAPIKGAGAPEGVLPLSKGGADVLWTEKVRRVGGAREGRTKRGEGGVGTLVVFCDDAEQRCSRVLGGGGA